MSLIEVMIALAIAAAMMAIAGLSAAGLTAQDRRSASLELAANIRYVYERAAINGWRYDIVLDFDTHEYWAECHRGHVSADREERDPTASEIAFGRDPDDPFATGAAATPELQGCDDRVIQRGKLGRNIEFDRVITMRSDEEIVEGQARIAMFPNGFAERSVIWIKDSRDKFMTLFVDEMTGRVVIEGGDQDLPRDYFDVEED